MTESAIEVRGLRKSYAHVEAVRGVDLEIRHGEVFALLGPNGAGKTTTVEILEGFRERDAGEVSVLGSDPGRADQGLRARIGIVLQSTGVDPFLTVEETIEMYRGFFPEPRPVDEVLEVVGLGDHQNVPVRRLSGGQQRRLDVGVGLAGDPELLFLDEPTTGFDPAARRGAWQMVKNLAALGKTVFLTTHYMDEAQELAERVAIIAAGRILAEGSPDTLGGRATAATVVRFRLPASAELPPELAAEAHLVDRSVRITTDDPTETLHRVTGWAVDRGIRLEELAVARPTLEDVYLEITGSAEGTG